MKETEKAYIAGIINGEDSIMLTKFHKNEYHSPYVSIASTDFELLEWIKSTVGSGKESPQRKIIILKNIKLHIAILLFIMML